MWVFGCAWKINFSEIIFSWPGVLKALTRKWVEVKIFTSNHFRTHAHREREREREPSTSTSTSPIYEPITPLTSPTSPITPSTSPIYELIYEPMNRSSTQSLRPTDLRLCRRPRAFMPRTNLRPRAFDLEPRTHESISLCVWFWSTHKPMSLWSLNFYLFFLVVVWVVVFWWFSCCVVVGFVWVVVENSIFRMLNTWKYFLEQFS